MDFFGSAAPLPGFRNLIINGNFAINQRGYASGGALNNSNIYAHDRWRDFSNGSSYTFTQNSPDTAITLTSGSLLQYIEGANIAGGNYVLSWNGTATLQVFYVNAQRTANIFVAAGSSPLQCQNIPTGLQVLILTQNAGSLDKVQFEAGSTPTLFERRPLAVEMLLCQRYAYVANDNDNNGAAANSSTTPIVKFVFPTPMRSAPTASLLVASDWWICDGYAANVQATTVGINAVYNTTARSVLMQINGFSNLVVGRAYYGGGGGLGAGRILLSAEL